VSVYVQNLAKAHSFAVKVSKQLMEKNNIAGIERRKHAICEAFNSSYSISRGRHTCMEGQDAAVG
jgi:hypothetical protein